MYIKVHRRANQWFRDDNGTLVGTNIDTYYNLYHSGKTPIIETPDGSYFKVVYGRILPETNTFIPLCEGAYTRLCTGMSCKAYNSGLLCPKNNNFPEAGFFIITD